MTNKQLYRKLLSAKHELEYRVEFRTSESTLYKLKIISSFYSSEEDEKNNTWVIHQAINEMFSRMKGGKK